MSEAFRRLQKQQFHRDVQNHGRRFAKRRLRRQRQINKFMEGYVSVEEEAPPSKRLANVAELEEVTPPPEMTEAEIAREVEALNVRVG